MIWKWRKTGISRARLGVIGTAVLLALLIGGLSSSSIAALINPSYRAAFTEAGGLMSGDNVIISGVNVGKVTAVDLAGDHVEVSFTISDGAVRLGRPTRASITAVTLLGKRGLQLQSAGPGSLPAGSEIPVDRP